MNKPPISSSTSSVISSYRRRRQRRTPNLITLIAGLLVLGGVILLIIWLTGPSKPLDAIFATDTPTPTITPSPTNTSTPSATPTITETPTITATATASAPFQYTVQENDSLFAIAQKFGLGENGIKLILYLNPYSTPAAANQPAGGINPANPIVIPGQVIWVPNPGMPLPTATPIPPDLPAGTKIAYTVESGDSIALIAGKFNSTEDAIIKENSIEDPNSIFVGQQLIIPVNLVTPTATRPPTSTPAATGTPTVTATP
jgi:LysM repeat protein